MELTALFSDLVRFETDLWNALDARLRDVCDLRISRFDTMRVIARTTPCRVFDIAGGLSITVGGASKVVDRIEALGHCVRRSNPDDRRSSIIELTPVGRSLLAEAAAVVEDELALRLGSALPAHSLAQLAATLTTLRAAAPNDRRTPQ